MELKRPSLGSDLQGFLAAAWAKRARGLAGQAVYTLVVLLVGALVYRSGVVQKTVGWVRQDLPLVPRMVRGALADPARLTLDIKHKHFLQIAAKRREAVAKGILISSPGDFVPATIRFGEQVLAARIRLKGDFGDHWAGDKWSFRVVLQGKQTLFGMKQFSLQHPMTRGYLTEWFYHQVLRRAGLIALRYDYLDLTLNGNSMGIYAIEEHFDARLIANNQRPPGPIIRFDEELTWRELLHFDDARIRHRERRGGAGAFLASEIDGFQGAEWLADPAQRGAYLRATGLLEAFRQRKLRVSQVFDVSSLGRYLALQDVFGGAHAANWRNIRFYYNPMTGRLEPVGFDSNGGGRIADLLITLPNNDRDDIHRHFYHHSAFWESLFDDPALRYAYFRALEEFSHPDYFESLLVEIGDSLRAKAAIVYRIEPAAQLPMPNLLANQAYVRRMLHPVRGVQAYLQRADAGQIAIELGNLQILPLEIGGLALGDSLIEQRPLTELAGRADADLVNFQPLRFAGVGGLTGTALQSLRVRYRVPGTSTWHSDPVLLHPRPNPTAREEVTQEPPNAASFAFVTFDPARRAISIRPGLWRLTRSLVLPPGYRVFARAGTTFQLLAGAAIVSYSPIDFVGTADQPILIESPDSAGVGLMVQAVDSGSVMSHVVMRNLRGAQADGLRAAVTFHRAPVTMEDLVIEGTGEAPALRLSGTRFEILGAHVLNSGGDGILVEHSRGRVVDSRVVATMGDAVSATGSSLRMRGVTIRRSQGRGVRATGFSVVSIDSSEITATRLAVESSDLSTVRVDGLEIGRARVGLAAFQRRPEYGAARIRAVRVVFRGGTPPLLAQPGSTLTVNGQPQTDLRPDMTAMIDSLIRARRT